MARAARWTDSEPGGFPRRQTGRRPEHRKTGSRESFPAFLRTQRGPRMNRGLLIRALRESWPATLVLGLVLMAAEAILAFVLPKYGAQLSEQFLQFDFARGLLKAMLGTEVGDRIGSPLFHSIAWVHPVVLALTWAHALVCCTRVPAGEVDRGTVDVLLGL